MITGRINQVIVRLRVRPRLRRAGRSLCAAEATFRRPNTLILHSEMTAFELATAQPSRKTSGSRAARSTFMLALFRCIDSVAPCGLPKPAALSVDRPELATEPRLQSRQTTGHARVFGAFASESPEDDTEHTSISW